MIVGVQATLQDGLLKKAAENAAKNWETWKDDFEHRLRSENGDFKTLPVFQSQPRFYGFGFDYSVFRLYDRAKLEELRKFLSGMKNPDSHGELHCEWKEWAKKNDLSIRGGEDTQRAGQILQVKHISIVSKLLALWKPAVYPMWDTLAREGLKLVMKPKKASRYDGNSVGNYEIFRSDFKTLADEWWGEIESAAKCEKFDECNSSSVYRTLDSYLMLVAEEERVAKAKRKDGAKKKTRADDKRVPAS